MNRAEATDLLRRLHQAQGRFYAGHGEGDLRALLSENISWQVPGDNAIAGHYQGIDEVMAYFARRRDLARRSLRLYPGELLVGEGEMVASLTDGEAVLGGREHRWSTVGLYRVAEGRVRACWLLPLDAAAFDRIWAAPSTAAGPGGEEQA
jgi:ketosteroid isomerase-like protein